MDRVLSARIDEAWVLRLAELSRRLKVTKKEILERALALFAAEVEAGTGRDFLRETCGAWERKEAAGDLVEQARRQFREAMRQRR